MHLIQVKSEIETPFLSLLIPINPKGSFLLPFLPPFHQTLSPFPFPLSQGLSGPPPPRRSNSRRAISARHDPAPNRIWLAIRGGSRRFA